MAKFEIIMPKLGESIIEATITRWVKNVGDTVDEDDSIVEIATDKVDSEIPSPVEGKLIELLYSEGDVVPVGKVIAIIAMDGEDAEPTSASATETKVEEINTQAASNAETVAKEETKQDKATAPKDFSSSSKFYSPLVKSIAKTESISVAELDTIQGSGKDGRVTKADVLGFIEKRKSGPRLRFHFSCATCPQGNGKWIYKCSINFFRSTFDAIIFAKFFHDQLS